MNPKFSVLLIVLFCMFLVLPLAKAADSTSGAELTAEPPEEAYDSLRLSPEQKQQIEPLLEQRRQDISQVMHDSTLTSQEKWAKADEIRSQSRIAVDQYLTSQQKEKADPIRVENDAQRQKVRTEQEKVINDKATLKSDRKQTKENAQNNNNTLQEEDREKLKQDRKVLSEDRAERHEVRQQGKAERRERRRSAGQ